MVQMVLVQMVLVQMVLVQMNQTFNINNLPISPIQNVFKNCRDMDKEPIPLLNDSSCLKFSIVLDDSEINLTKAGIQTLLQENNQNYQLVLKKCLSKIESNNNSIINTILSSTTNITDDSFIKLDNNNLKEKFEILWFKNQQQQYEIDQLKVQLKQSQYKQYLNTPHTLQDDIGYFLYMNEEDGPKQLFELVNKEIQTIRNILNKNKWTQRFIRTTINTSKKEIKRGWRGKDKLFNYIINIFPASKKGKSFILNNELIRALISEKLHHVEPVNEKQIEVDDECKDKDEDDNDGDDDEENENDDDEDDDEDEDHQNLFNKLAPQIEFSGYIPRSIDQTISRVVTNDVLVIVDDVIGVG
ncbi:hypothetical protein ACTFIZ_002283 [Dictyostelium cf. discoideum]